MHYWTPHRLVIFAIIALGTLFGASSCTYDGAAFSSAQCDQEGAQRDDSVCRDGYWVAGEDSGDKLDAVEPDVIAPDADTPDAPEADGDLICDPPVEQEVCSTDDGQRCGTITIVDDCGNQHDIDCEGCPSGQRCAEDLCVEPSCEDGLQNQEESDIDCGGPNCAPCTADAACNQPADCASGLCGYPRSTRGLIALYTFDEGIGDTVHDQAGDHVGDAGQPINLRMDGAVDWESGAVRLSGGVLRSDATGPLYEQILDDDHAFTLEAWVEAASTDQSGPARIVSLSDGTGHRNLTLGPDNDEMRVRLRRDDSNDNGTPAIVVDSDGTSTNLEHYVVALQDQKLRYYRNGEIVTVEDVPGDLSDWDASYPLLIGNETTQNRSWSGLVHLVAFYNRALDPREVQSHFEHGVAGNPPEDLCRGLNPYVAMARSLGAVVVLGQLFDGLIRDESGNGHHGVASSGVEWIPEAGPPDTVLPGYLAHQSSSDSYTEIADHADLDLTSSHTIAYWRHRSAPEAGPYEAEFAKGNNTYQLRTFESDRTRLLYTLRPNDTSAVTPEDTVILHEWHFVAVVFDQSAQTMSVYIDDMSTPVVTEVRSQDVGINDLPLTLGAWRNNEGVLGRHANVDITGFTVFDRALDATERAALRDAE